MPPFASHALAHSLQIAAVDEQTFAHSVTSLVIVIADSLLVGASRADTPGMMPLDPLLGKSNIARPSNR
jgi:hypothetical protein